MNIEKSFRYSLTLESVSYTHLSYDLSPGKRFKVNPTNFEITEEENDYSTIEITFNIPSGSAESIATTLTDFNLEEEWQFSQGLVAEDYKYTCLLYTSSNHSHY